ncbi:unnamed protein product [Ixodes hexagonus]
MLFPISFFYSPTNSPRTPGLTTNGLPSRSRRRHVPLYKRMEARCIFVAVMSSAIITHVSLQMLLSYNDETTSLRRNKTECERYSSSEIPPAILRSNSFQGWYSSGKITTRRCPRVVVNLLLFHNEVELLEIRLHELGDVVDHFIVLENSVNLRKQAKQLYLPPILKGEKFLPFRGKLLYFSNSRVPNYPAGIKATILRALLRAVFVDVLSATFVSSFPSLRDDTLVIFNSADEIPRADVVKFLRHHDGFPDRIALRFVRNMYRFNAVHGLGESRAESICSLRYLKTVLRGSLESLRRADHSGTTVRHALWTIGTKTELAGWHCSWCLDPDGIIVKMMSQPEVTDTGLFDPRFIARMVKSGKWHNETVVAFDSPVQRVGAMPEFVRQNRQRFKHLLGDI